MQFAKISLGRSLFLVSVNQIAEIDHFTMALSDISWNLNIRPPLFQVYGTKRKLTSQETTGYQHSISSKKRCLLAVQSDPGSDEMEINHNTVAVLNQNATPNRCHLLANANIQTGNQQFSHQIQLSPASQTMPCDSLQSNNNISSPQSSDLNIQLHNESCSTADASQLGKTAQNERNYNYMDLDCSPDPHQQNKHLSSDQCCVGGDQNPTSGRVHCFCKPSWENLMETRPSVSDYY